MRINKIQLSSGSNVLTLPIFGAQPSDPYLLKNADGLGPSDIDLYIDNASGAGGFYQGRKPQLLFPVLTVGLNPNYGTNSTISDLRSALYWVLSPQNDNPALTLSLMLDNVVVAVATVYVKSCVPNPFSKDPQMVISMESTDRHFHAPIAITNLPTNVGGTYPLQVNNPGTVNCGFHLKLTLTADATQLIIANQQTGKQMIVNAGFSNTDILELNTAAGSRSITLLHFNPAPTPATLFSLLDQVDSSNSWLSLVPGINNLSVSLVGNLTNFDYIPRYWGI